MSSIISIMHLSKSYNGVKAVDDLTLDVKQGQFFGFLGPNGAGKTTTIRILTGMIRADAGEAIIDGKPLNERERISRIIGALPESKGFYVWMNALEYLSYFADLYGIEKSKQKGTIISLLEKVHMREYQELPISAYSRGMKQRVALARALINSPKLLFLDEPTLGLDPQGQIDIQNVLQELHKIGVTIFLSSHLLPEVSKLCTTIAIIHHGKLVAEGTLDKLKRDNAGKEQYTFTATGTVHTLAFLHKVEHISNIEQSENHVTFTFTGNEKKANECLDSLRKKGIIIRDFTPATDSLTNIFLNLTRN